MSGLVTERDFAEAECAFPGIEVFYAGLARKPPTFLDLVRLYWQRESAEVDDPAPTPSQRGTA